MQIEKLKYLAQHFDPFNHQSLTPEIQELLEELELQHLIHSPLDFTNKLLKLLHEDIENEPNLLH